MSEPTAGPTVAPFIAINNLRKSFALGGAVVHALAAYRRQVVGLSLIHI